MCVWGGGGGANPYQPRSMLKEYPILTGVGGKTLSAQKHVKRISHSDRGGGGGACTLISPPPTSATGDV